jgi:hypothetical protein
MTVPFSLASLSRAALALLLAASFHPGSARAAEKAKLTLKGSPSVGSSSTVFRFRAVLTGGVDSEDLYCLTTEWEWEEQADASLNEAECPPFKAGETPIERTFTEEQSFRRPGPHLVRVVLRKADREIASASTTVTVRREPTGGPDAERSNPGPL